MEQVKLTVYTNLDKNEENYEIIAIKKENEIKYIDLSNNIMKVNIDNDVIERENNDYSFNIDFINNKIFITMKRLNKTFIKDIKTIYLKKDKHHYTVKYKLIDDEIINEYSIKL